MTRLFNTLTILASFLILAACGEPASRNDSGEVVASGDIDVFNTKVGDCFNDQASESDVTDVPGVPCSEPHDNEVFALIDTTLTSYPGEDEMFETATDECIGVFKDFVGASYDKSILAVFPLVPTLDSWKRLNDREIICALYHMDQDKLTGTMRGKKI